jgi:hypothetical protein
MEGWTLRRRPLIDEVTAWTKTVLGMQLVDSGDHVCELFCHRGAEVRAKALLRVFVVAHATSGRGSAQRAPWSAVHGCLVL